MGQGMNVSAAVAATRPLCLYIGRPSKPEKVTPSAAPSRPSPPGGLRPAIDRPAPGAGTACREGRQEKGGEKKHHPAHELGELVRRVVLGHDVRRDPSPLADL